MSEQTLNPYTHRIYALEPGKKNFKPMNLRNGTLVTNLIYASMLPESEALKVVAELTTDNSEWKFEARKI